MHALFLSLSLSLIINLQQPHPSHHRPSPLHPRSNMGRAMNQSPRFFTSCPTRMQITEGSAAKAPLIKTRCLTHYDTSSSNTHTDTHAQLVARTRRQSEQQVACMKNTATSVEIKCREARLADFFFEPTLSTEIHHLSRRRHFAKTKRRIEH